MNMTSHQPEIDITALIDDELESTLVVSDFLTRFHKHIAVSIFDDNDDGDDAECKTAAAESAFRTVAPDQFSRTSGGPKEPDIESIFHKDNIVISPQDVLSAIAYKHDVERYRLLASLVETVQQPGFYDSDDLKRKNHDEDLDKLLEEEAQHVWRRMQSRIDEGRMSSDQDVSKLLEAAEVMMAKEISTDLLLNKVNAINVDKGMVPCCSTLLGVPSGNYLSIVLPECRYDAEPLKDEVPTANDEPTLPVPANSLTWKELLRLSTMVSKVQDEDDRSAVYKSVLTHTQMSGDFIPSSDKPTNIYNKDKHFSEEKLLLTTASELRGTDIVALWLQDNMERQKF